jgi:hypothetical protein
MVYTQSFGSRPENVEVPHIDSRAPSASDILYPIGKRWIYVNNSAWELIGLTTFNGATTANWVQTVSSVGDVLSVSGTTNQVTAAPTSGNVVLSTPATFIAPGSITSTTSLTATLGNITATNGNFVKGTAGNKDVYTSLATTAAAGANSAGTVTLVGGTATIATTAVTAASKIRYSRQSVGATGAAATGNLSIGTITAGVSFIINSVTPTDTTALATTDVSVIFWEIVN